jgi:hypothetical protein
MLDSAVLARVFELGGLGVFIWFCIRGLQQQICALKTTIDTQRETLDTQASTLDAMERRVLEAERLGGLYRNLVAELPKDLDNYTALMRTIKDELIQELQLTLARKNKELESRTYQLPNHGLLVEHVSALRTDLADSFQALEGRLSVLDLFARGTSLRELLVAIEHAAQTELPNPGARCKASAHIEVEHQLA